MFDVTLFYGTYLPWVGIGTRVVDPVYFRPDPNNWNFKNWIRILRALTHNQFKHLPIFFLHINQISSDMFMLIFYLKNRKLCQFFVLFYIQPYIARVRSGSGEYDLNLDPPKKVRNRPDSDPQPWYYHLESGKRNNCFNNIESLDLGHEYKFYSKLNKYPCWHPSKSISWQELLKVIKMV